MGKLYVGIDISKDRLSAKGQIKGTFLINSTCSYLYFIK